MTRSEAYRHFRGTSAPLAFDGAAPVLAALRRCLPDWPDHPAQPVAAPLGAVVAGRKGGYDVTSCFTDRQAEGLPEASAVCSLIADLSLDFCAQTTNALGLHAAAVASARGLFVLGGPARAGKTTLACRLALVPELRFVCDDVLALTRDGQGVALGIAPRLRLPVPEGSAALQRAAREDLIVADDRYGYLRLAQRLPFGTRVPLAGYLAIERVERGGPRLFALSQADAVAAVLRRVITGVETAEQGFDMLEAVLAGVPKAQFVYSDLDEAAAFLTELFQGEWPEDLPPYEPPPEVARTRSAPLVSPDLELRQNPQAISRQIGARHWLTLPEDGSLWELNPTARALWVMLAMPGTSVELAEALADLFPGVPPERIAQDAGALLAELVQAGLVLA